jgi:hypothetical protein
VATFLQLKNIIRNRLNEDYLDEQIADAINSTIRFYEQNHFWFNENVATITLNTGDPVIPDLPSDFLTEVLNGGLNIIDGQSHYKLGKINIIQYEANNSESTGIPSLYINRNDQLEIYPFPDKDYVLKLFYIQSFPDLVNDSDTNPWTINAPRLIEAKTIEDLWLNQRKDIERWQFFKAKTNEEFRQIQKLNIKRVSTGTLVTEDIVNTADAFGLEYFF